MKRFSRYFFLLLISPIRWLIFFILGFSNRSKNIWVFGAWDGYRFADNTKWFFIHCNKSQYTERCIWITRDRRIVKNVRDRGYEAYYFLSFKGIWYSTRAKFYILDHSTQDINFITSRNAYKIFLFHGIPLKKIRRDIKNRNNFNYKVYYGSFIEKLLFKITRPYLYEVMDYISVTSQVNKKIFSSAIGVKNSNISINGYPRNDIILNPKMILDTEDLLRVNDLNYLKAQKKTIIFYLPTWRDHQRERDEPFDWEKMNEFLVREDSVLVFKGHSYDSLKMSNGRSYENIISLHHSEDIYPILQVADILITDYSSISFDFLLTRKPIIYYCYDIDEYISNSRAFYHKYNDVTPGPKAMTFEDLLKEIEVVISNPNYISRWGKKYKYTLNLCHTYKDANSSERLYHDIKTKFIDNN